MTSRLYIAVLLMAVTLQGKGQSDRLPVQYFLTPSLVNPALSGKGNNIELRVGYRHRVIGIDGSPATYFFNGEKTYFPQGGIADRLRRKMAEWTGHQNTEVSGLLKVDVGAFAIRSEQGAFQHLEAGFNTAIHVPVGSRSFLSLGISPRIRNNRIDLSDLVVRDAAMDQSYQSLLLNGTSNTYFNINSGFSFHSGEFLIAYGIDKLANALVSGNEDLAIDDAVEHRFMGSYSLLINPDMELIPTALIRIISAFPVFYDAGVRWRYKRNIWAGLSYRSNKTLLGSLGFTTNHGIVFGYSYQHRSAGLDDFNNGSHEVVLGLSIE
ncbi:type IX secretion system membrane protein PorP/SprF [Fulvivirga sp. M361]|uniref:PorP/SprF family type IX secretion system membrane protein n=1 Tax=Fulvivirga sp. M361 TaxID=2594266 RepID=UPI00117B0228|nr:PorP/SprF family type IX secretion system membrane protein [Fulvivirga sp. M361]TRX60071.1 type IX secretion system membrane protein PorP/SprF [Fulvivirga sp. M361]